MGVKDGWFQNGVQYAAPFAGRIIFVNIRELGMLI